MSACSHSERTRGRLKVFLGYAAGVGKTYQMLSEAREMKGRGIDVVVGYFEPHGRRETIALTEGLKPSLDRRSSTAAHGSRRWTPAPS